MPTNLPDPKGREHKRIQRLLKESNEDARSGMSFAGMLFLMIFFIGAGIGAGYWIYINLYPPTPPAITTPAE